MRWNSKALSIGVAAMLGSASLVCFSACEYHAVGGTGDQGAGVKPVEAPTVVQTSATENSPAQGADQNADKKSQPPARPKLKPGARTKVLSRAGNLQYDKTFDDLRFEMEVGTKFLRSMLTKEIEALDGTKIRIRGFFLPGAQNRGITQFVLVRDNQECCFGPGAALYDCILVDMPVGKTIDYTRVPIAVEGIFNIREFVVAGKHMAIYQMDAETVK
jgi:hypothetical protein